jgi:general secretion pathway protein M
MRLLPEARNRRFLAVVLLLIVVLMVYLVGVHWWFVAPHMDISQQMSDLRDQQEHFSQIVRQRGAIEKRLAKVRGFEQNNLAFLPDADPNSAFSDLSQRLKQALDVHVAAGGNRCQVTGTSPFASRDPEVYQRVSAAVVMTCDTETFAAVLYDLENSNPYLFVDRLVVFRQQPAFFPGNAKPPSNGMLGIQFNLSGYLRQPGKVTP